MDRSLEADQRRRQDRPALGDHEEREERRDEAQDRADGEVNAGGAVGRC